jgi:hypothetical protein
MNAIEVLGFVATAYFTAPLSLLAGGVTLSSTLPTLGMLCGLVGLFLVYLSGEKRAHRLIWPFLLALLLPTIIFLMNIIMRRVGIWFGGVGGLVTLLIWVAVLANDTRNRLPAWLLGLFILSYGAYAGLAMLAIDGG